MKWCVALVLVGVCGAQDPVEAELTRLRERVAQLEAQRQDQEEVNGLLLRAMDATTEKLELFLQAVQDGSLQAGPVAAEPESPTGESDGWTTALAVSGLALGFALVAWLWSLRSPVVVVGGLAKREESSVRPSMTERVPSKTERVAVKPEKLAPSIELDTGAPVLMEPVAEIVTEGNGKRSEQPEVAAEELGLANVLAVELEEASEDAGISDQAPCRVQWKLTCANPAVGEKLVLDLFAREPRVLGEPAPRVEAQGHSLRIGYHVHPGLPVAERTQIAARLTEVLEGVPPASSLRGGSVR
jgi:hypothetical protein